MKFMKWGTRAVGAPRRLRAPLALLALGAVALLAGCGGGSKTATTQTAAAEQGGALETKTIKVGIMQISDLMQFFVAQKKGYFKQEGLKVVPQEMVGGAAIAPAVQSGQIDIGWSNVVSIVIAHTKGFEFVYLGSGVFQGPGHYNQAILVAKNSTISGPQDLVGKRIALNTLGNINQLEVLVYLKDGGVDPSKVHLVEVSFPDQLGALEQHRVDAAAAAEPFVTIGTKNGTAKILAKAPFTAFGKQPLIAGWFSTRSWLEAHPNTAAAFSRAIDKATTFIHDHPQEAAAILPDYTKLAPDLASAITLPLFKAKITSSDVAPYVTDSKKFGLTSKTFDASEILWNGG